MSAIRTSALIILLILLAACGSLLESNEPPGSLWWLEPTQLSASGDIGQPDLAIEVAVVPGLDTDQILNLDDNARLNVYAGARWAEYLPELIASLVARSLESQGTRTALRSYAAEDACFAHLEVREFYGLVNGAQETQSVSVVIAGEIDCGDVEKNFLLSKRVTVDENRMSSIVAAFQAALDDTMNQLAGNLRPGN